MIGELLAIGLPKKTDDEHEQLPLYGPGGHVPFGTPALVLEKTSDFSTVLTPYGIIVISPYYLIACM